MNRKTTTWLTILLLCLTMVSYGQQHQSYKYNIEKDNYYEWSTWTDEQQSFYILGLLSGSFAMGAELSFNSHYADLLAIAREILPDYTIREYRNGITYIYEVQETRTIPVWAVVFRFEELIELRRSMK